MGDYIQLHVFSRSQHGTTEYSVAVQCTTEHYRTYRNLHILYQLLRAPNHFTDVGLNVMNEYWREKERGAYAQCATHLQSPQVPASAPLAFLRPASARTPNVRRGGRRGAHLHVHGGDG